MNSDLKQNKTNKIYSNPNKETLTIEKLKILLNCDLPDDEANEMVLSIRKLVSILVNYQCESELKQQNTTDPNLKQAA
jgi:hypothetical protein